jgi:type IV pilus assembly protein PilO
MIEFKELIEQQIKEIKEFELNKDSIAVAGDWPIVIKTIAVLALAAGVVFGSHFYYLKKIDAQMDKVSKSKSELVNSINAKISLTSNIELYDDKIKGMNDSFKVLLSQLPTDIEMEGLLRDITNKGLRNNVTFKKFKMLPESASEFYTEHPIEMVVIGKYHGIATFVSDVANLDRIVTFHDYELKKVDKSSKLEFKITAKTYN